jgi:hypothetical protein
MLPNHLRVALGLILAIMTGACTTSYSVDVPDAAESVRAAQNTGVVAVLDAVPPLVDGRGRVVRSEGSERKKVKYRLSDTNLFSSVVDTDPQQARAVTLTFQVDNGFDYHGGGNATKGVMIGLSMGLLAPALKMNVDYKETITVQVSRWDGVVTTHSASGNGSSHYHYMDIGAERVLVTTVHDEVMDALMNKLVEDVPFYQMK